MTLDPQRYRLAEDQHQAIFDEEIKPTLFGGVMPSAQPVAVIFGGQPGAGKSAAVAAANHELQAHGGCVEIIGDDLRGFHPDYDRLLSRDDKTAAFYTDRDTGRWVEKAIAEAKSLRVNLVIEGTMRDADKVAQTMQSLRAAGYLIDARALAVNERLSQQGILQRYESQKADRGHGRMTTTEAHQAAFVGMLRTLDRIEGDKLADRVTLCRRSAEVIYTNALQAGQWAKEPQARQALESERNRPLTLDERRDYARGFDKLAEALAQPSRRASAEEVNRVAELQRQARALVSAEVLRSSAAPEKALREHPELAASYAAIGAIEAKAQAEGFSPKQCALVAARARENAASAIERGSAPGAATRTAEQSGQPSREPSKGRGPER